MGSSSSFCYFPIEIAVRIIGTVSLIIYAFVFTLLCSGTEDLPRNAKIRIILGMDSRLFLHLKNDEIDWFPVLCLMFCALFIISGTLLICSSITRQRTLTVPWLICSTANIISHLGTLALLPLSHYSIGSKWEILLTVLYTGLVTYFSIVVLIAQYSWRAKKAKRIQRKKQDVWEDIFRPPVLPPDVACCKSQN